LGKSGLRVISGGTDTHLSLIDVGPKGVTGKEASSLIGKARITVNKNLIPFDKKSAFLTSGIRLGTPAVTTRLMKEAQMHQIADIINLALTKKKDPSSLEECRKKVEGLTKKFPLYPEIGA